MARIAQLHDRYGQALAANAVLVILAALAAIANVVISDRKKEWKLPPWAPVATLAALCVFALIWAWQLRWLSDDAFISFRYARNWVDGHGLVFNHGERVEGYTNFLWVAMLAIPNLIGLDIPTMAVLFCLASQIGVLIMTTRLAIASTSCRMWVDSRIVFSWPIWRRVRRTSAIWLGSRPAVGSSMMRTSGSCSRA